MKEKKTVKKVVSYFRLYRSIGCENWKGKPGCYHDKNTDCEHACHLKYIKYSL